MTKELSHEEFSRWLRLTALKMTSVSGASHVGSCFSIADILSVLYNGWLDIDPNVPLWDNRDRFILSKGHAAAILYAALAKRGFIDEQQLDTYYQNGSCLMGHASHHVPGIELSTGSLGHGLAVAAGIAISAKISNRSYKVVALMSDGECDEGSVWEAALFAGHHKLSNLYAIIDYNKIQSLASTTVTLDLEPFGAKWEAFGWDVREVDGHDCRAIASAMNKEKVSNKPICIIAHTIKGKGVSFMENSVLWHYRSPRGKEYDSALRELRN